MKPAIGCTDEAASLVLFLTIFIANPQQFRDTGEAEKKRAERSEH
jgi:hypothetical protein